MIDILIHNLKHSVMITIFVFVMMLFIDYINVLTRGKMENAVRGGRGRQYLVASFLGVTPGCLGAFMNVSFYVHGLLSFGAIVGGMIATSGDEAFVMLALFPRKALLLFGIMFILGILGAWISDKTADLFGITPCEECKLQEVHEEKAGCFFEPKTLKEFPELCIARYISLAFIIIALITIVLGIIGTKTWGWKRITIFSCLIFSLFIVTTTSKHYFKEHIWEHIIKKHLWRVFLWTFFALSFIKVGLHYWNLETFVKRNMGFVLLISAFVGIIPESGPHLIFVMMYANGLIPFSVLLTSSIAQDGHGMLPLLSYTIRDSILIKIFNIVFALLIGLIFYYLGS
jgi:hypothetical protein